MLSRISWGQYLGMISVLLTAYYLAIAVLYYRNEIYHQLMLKLRKIRKTDEAATHEDSLAAEGGSMDEIASVTHDLRYTILERIGCNANKAELMLMLQKRLAGYKGLQDPANREDIIRFLILHAQEICNVTFEEQELNSAWNTVLR